MIPTPLARAILISLLALAVLLPAAAYAQPAFGPPAPSPLLNPAASPAANSSTDPLNPFAILDAAGQAINRTAQQSAAPDSTNSSERGGLSTALNILVVLTIVSLAPSIMLMTTCFVRILIVLGLLKQAMGTATIPPPQVITGLALFMTLLVMSPTLDRINSEAIVPYRAGEITDYDELWTKARQPMRDFMFAQIDATGNWSSVYMVLERQGVDVSDPARLTRADVSMVALVPAYMLSELKTAFLMGFRLYLPFLVIDMVISTMLISMSMMMLPPVLISLPFKLLLFVLVDGWTLIVGSLMAGFAQPLASDPSVALLPSLLDPVWSEQIAHASRCALGHLHDAARLARA